MIHRELVLLLGGALTVGRGLRAQQKAMPAVGYLHFASPGPFTPIVAPFLRTAAQVGRSFAMAQPQAVVMAPHNYTSTWPDWHRPCMSRR
jgi:hypothetical protein